MDLHELRNELEARGYNYLPEKRLNYFINRGYLEFCLRFPWPYLEHEENSVTLPYVPDPALRAMIWLVNDQTQISLPGIDPREVRRLDPTGDRTGTPVAWYVEGQTLKFFPENAGQTATFRYIQTPPMLAGDADEPLVPADLALYIVDRAVVEALKDTDELAAAQEVRRDWENQVDRLAGNTLRNNYQNNAQIEARRY